VKRLLRRFAGIVPVKPDAAAITTDQAVATPPGPAIEAAVEHHRAGRLQQAEASYRQVLAEQPRNFDALHLLGVIALQRGEAERATELIGEALAVDASSFSAHGNLAAAYQALNRLDDAERSLRTALELKPDWDGARNTLGVICQARGRPDEAEACFREALKSNPDSAEAVNNLGGIQRDRGHLAEAEACFRRALALNPNFVQACDNLGHVLQGLGRLDEAETWYLESLRLLPDSAEASNGMGSVCNQKGRPGEAEEWFRRALTVKPDMLEATCNLGDTLQGLDRLDEAEDCCRRALALRPGYADAMNTLGTIFEKQNRLEEAESCYRQALLSDPRHAAACGNLGTLAGARGALDEAETHFRRAITFDPTSAAAKYNLATLTLLRGNYREGLALYEHRFEAFTREFVAGKRLNDRLPAERRWRGEDLAARRLLVWADQGIGDSLMVMRYLPMLKSRGAGEVTVWCEQALQRLMQATPGVDAVVTNGEMPDPLNFDMHCPIMSLPFMFAASPESIPHAVPYLSVAAQLEDQWGERLAEIRKKKVGVAWAGNKSLRDDGRRSIALRELAPLLHAPDIQPISLQKGEATDQLAQFDGLILDYMNLCHDFMDTAALVQNLDLVISVDTAVAHLAGALGKPVWLLNRWGGDWRWGPAGEDSPWYPTLRILRQTERDDWSGVIAEVVARLTPC